MILDMHQQAVLDPISKTAKYMFYSIRDHEKISEKLYILKRLIDGKSALLGIGYDIVDSLGKNVPGLEKFPDFNSKHVNIPETQHSLWIWLKDEDAGKNFHQARVIHELLKDTFYLEEMVDAFSYCDRTDLSGFEDGTENPEGDDAKDAGIVSDPLKGLHGSSFVAVQKWQHDFKWLNRVSQAEKEETIGRSLDDNHEFEDAIASAHVRRTAQESFEPEAFMFRNSMPWSEGFEGGLMFVAFGKSFYAFDVQMRKMVGQDDDIVDGLFKFSRPLTGSYFWCPPFTLGRLDLSLLGI